VGAAPSQDAQIELLRISFSAAWARPIPETQSHKTNRNKPTYVH